MDDGDKAARELAISLERMRELVEAERAKIQERDALTWRSISVLSYPLAMRNNFSDRAS